MKPLGKISYFLLPMAGRRLYPVIPEPVNVEGTGQQPEAVGSQDEEPDHYDQVGMPVTYFGQPLNLPLQEGPLLNNHIQGDGCLGTSQNSLRPGGPSRIRESGFILYRKGDANREQEKQEKPREQIIPQCGSGSARKENYQGAAQGKQQPLPDGMKKGPADRLRCLVIDEIHMNGFIGIISCPGCQAVS
jgi:hypothetical protein